MNKKCQQCNSEASVRLIDIDVEGNFREIFLCNRHAESYKVLQERSYNLIENLETKPSGIVFSKYICPDCGCSREWIEKNKRFGCCRCYQVFDDLCSQGFKGNGIHFGKVPRKAISKEVFIPRIQFLKDKMQKFVKAENFEAAQVCRQQLRTIFKELKHASIDI